MKKLLKYFAPSLVFLFLTGIAYAASILTVPQGGTGAGTFPTKRIIISNNSKATGTLLSLAPGSDGTFLRASSSASSGFDFATVSGSGTVTGTGVNGFSALWNSAVNITTGTLRDNGTVSGVNATSSTVTFNVQGSGALNPFNVASSTGTSLFLIGVNGSTTISSLNNALPVRSTSGGSLFNGAINLGGSDVTGILSVANGGTGTNNLTSTDILFGNGTGAVGTSTNLQYIAGLNLFLQNGTGSFVQTSPTSTLISGGFIQNGGVVSYSTSTNVNASVFCNGGGAIVIPTSTTGNITLTLPDRDQLNTALTACGATVWPGGLAQQVIFNYSNFSVTTVASGTGESLNPILGSSNTIPAGGQGIVFGSFINQNSLVTGANSVGTSLILNIWTTQSTSSSPSIMGQILAADATGRGWGLTNLIAGSNITITTSTPGQITFASTASGGGSGTWTIVNGGQYNGTTLASTTDAVLIGTTTAQSLAHVFIQGTSTQPTLDLLNIASSTGASQFKVTSGGLVTANSSIYSLPSGNTARAVLIGDPPGSAFPGMWCGASAASPDYTNYCFLYDSSSGPIFNSNVASGAIHFRIQNATSMVYNSNGLALNNGTSGAGSTVALLIAGTKNIGFGTTTPTGYLHLHEDASSTASSAFYSVASTMPVLQLGQKPLSSPSANGTYIGINTPSTFTGNLMFLQNNGTSELSLTSGGALTVNGAYTSTAGILDLVSSNQRIQGTSAGGIFINYVMGTNQNANLLNLRHGGADATPTAGISNGLFLSAVTAGNGFAPTSGTAVYNMLHANQVIRQTSSANGITRGLYLNPILTSAYDYRNFEIAATTTTVSNAASPAQAVYNVLFNPITYQTASTTKYTIASATTLSILGNPIASTTSLALTNSIGLYINGGAVTASTSNAYGEYVVAATGATNNYAGVWMGGNVGIGTTTPSFGAVFTGTVQMSGLTTSAGLQTGVMCLDANGQVINDSVACLASSERFKKDIKDISGKEALEIVNKLNLVSFFYKPEFNGALQSNQNYNGQQLGLIAEEVEKVDPRLVVYETEGEFKGKPHSVRYEVLSAVVAKAVAEQQKQIDELKTTHGTSKSTQWLGLLGLLGLIPLFRKKLT